MRGMGGRLARPAPVLAAVLSLAIALLPAVAQAATVHAVDPAAVPLAGSTTGDRFTPLNPTRIYDAVQAVGKTADVHVTGVLGTGSTKVSIPATATAVVVNLTGTRASAHQYVEAYPTPDGGASRPLASQLNLGAGQTAADEVTLPVGAGGQIRLFHSAGSVTLLLDIAGYYSPSGLDTYTSVGPHRAYDSGVRSLLGQTPRFVSRALLGLPADANAVVVNLTAAGPSAGTYLTVWPGGVRPVVSDLDLARGEVRANLVTVAVGAAGLDLYDAYGRTRVVVDVEGWYDTSVTGSAFVPAGPTRVDQGTRLGPGGYVDEDLETSAAGVPSGASAALFTLTTTRVTAATYEQAYPTPSGSDTPPIVSNLNVATGATDANLVEVAVGAGGDVRIRNAGGSVTDIVDLAGYFVPDQPGNDVSAHQCSGSSFPDPPDSTFGVINPTAGDLAFSGVDPCLTAEDEWARGTGDESFYLALSDRGPSSANWPTGGCSGQDTASCARQFGASQAADVYADAGSSAGTTHGAEWWLDVETTATWQTGSGAAALNAQVVLGALAYLQGQGLRVGLYSTRVQWAGLIGTSTGFTSLQEWYADGGVTDQQLVRDCGTPFAGGSVTQVQDIGVGSSLDRDLRC